MTDRPNRGFQLANLDVGLLTDPKILQLVALVPDEGERACTILVYGRCSRSSWSCANVGWER